MRHDDPLAGHDNLPNSARNSSKSVALPMEGSSSLSAKKRSFRPHLSEVSDIVRHRSTNSLRPLATFATKPFHSFQCPMYSFVSTVSGIDLQRGVMASVCSGCLFSSVM